VKYLVPVFKVFLFFLRTSIPLLAKAWTYFRIFYAKIQPYYPIELGKMLFGLILIFFGGYFVTTIAVIEAVNLCGWDQFNSAFELIYEDFVKVMKANEEDNKIDADNDGIADVNQISSNELVNRKVRLFLKECDPQNLSMALGGIYSGGISVMATLRIKFARVITLGASIGQVLAKPSRKYLVGVFEKLIPEDYHKWIPVVINYFCRTIGIYIAWMIQRILSAFHSALRGSYIFTEAFAEWTKKKKYSVVITEGYFDEVFCVICSIVGIYWQISSWFSLPFLLKIVLFPIIFFETILSWCVAFS